MLPNPRGFSLSDHCRFLPLVIFTECGVSYKVRSDERTLPGSVSRRVWTRRVTADTTLCCYFEAIGCCASWRCSAFNWWPSTGVRAHFSFEYILSSINCEAVNWGNRLLHELMSWSKLAIAHVAAALRTPLCRLWSELLCRWIFFF